jgi:hypothetical protein
VDAGSGWAAVNTILGPTAMNARTTVTPTIWMSEALEYMAFSQGHC